MDRDFEQETVPVRERPDGDEYGLTDRRDDAQLIEAVSKVQAAVAAAGNDPAATAAVDELVRLVHGTSTTDATVITENAPRPL